MKFLYTGSVELAAVGVSASVFNLMSDLFNVPLLNITTSFVAEEQALISKEDDPSRSDDNGKFQESYLTLVLCIYIAVDILVERNILRVLISMILYRFSREVPKQEAYSFSINFVSTCCGPWNCGNCGSFPWLWHSYEYHVYTCCT